MIKHDDRLDGFLEMLPLGDDFTGLIELMRRAGLPEDEIEVSIENARRMREQADRASNDNGSNQLQ